jgi:UMF1 family MFS transporter
MALYLGKLADSMGLRKHFFVVFSLLTATAGASLTFLTKMPQEALLVYSFMAVFHQQALVFYNAMLISFTNMGLASGIGVASGYIGSALTLLFLARLMKIPDVFLQASLLFTILALPAITLLRNPIHRQKVKLKEVFKDKKFLFMILSILSLTEVANTLIAMMGVYLRKVYGLEDTHIYKVIGLSALGGVIGGVIFGRLSDKVSTYKLFPVGFALWTGFLITLYFVPKHAILLVGLLAGVSLAHLWTTSRVLIIESFPKTQTSVRLSFLSLTERIASTTGLLAWSLLLYITGDNYRLSALLMVIFPITGWILFRKTASLTKN